MADGTVEQSEDGSKRLSDISPDLIRAYVANLTKVLLLFAAVIGAYILATDFVGEDVFLDMLSTIGVELSLAKSILIVIAAIILTLTVFDTTALSSISLSITDKITYSHGNFFKTTLDFPTSSIIRSNYREYWPLKVGDLELELSGTTIKSIKIPYVTGVAQVSESIHRLYIKNNGSSVETL